MIDDDVAPFDPMAFGAVAGGLPDLRYVTTRISAAFARRQGGGFGIAYGLFSVLRRSEAPPAPSGDRTSEVHARPARDSDVPARSYRGRPVRRPVVVT